MIYRVTHTSSVVAVSFVFALSASASAQVVRFAAHRDFPSGYGPSSIAIGDLNGDQKQDVVSANHLDHTLTLLLGKGDGTFEPPRSVFLGADAAPRSVAIADFNLDGRADVAAANAGTHTIAVVPGNGDGTFQPVRTLTPGGTGDAIATGDFNGDGRVDLIVANAGSNDVAILNGNGDATFQAARRFGAGQGPAFALVADFDRNGKADVAVANTAAGTMSVLLGDGAGSFAAPRTVTAGSSPVSLAAADVDADGLPDLVSANTGENRVAVLLGNGDGTFQAARTSAAGDAPMAVAAGDFDRDSKLDLAVANDQNGAMQGAGAVSVLLGAGDGSFSAPRSFAVGGSSWAVAVGSFDGDSVPDLAAANTFSTTISILLGSGNGTFPAALTLATGRNPEGLDAGDFNADGHRDLVAASAGTNTVSIFLGNGNGTFRDPLTFGTGPVPVFVTVGDFNRDGRQDLVTANYGAGDYYSATVASTVSVLLGNGDGTFQAATAFEAGSGPHGIAVADFNRDGAPDLALSSGDDATLSVLIGNGNGTFQTMSSHAAGSSPKSVSVGDFNRDQRPDLVVSNHWSDTLSVFLGNGDGTFLPQQVFATDRNPAWIAVGDIDGDGAPDLAVANWFSTIVSILAGTGDGGFRAAVGFGAAVAGEKAVLADFDEDGQLDLAVANYFASSVSVLLNRTMAAPPPPRVATPTFTPNGGTYLGPQLVSIAVATPGATIHYTTDGSTPTAASPVYSTPIPVARNTTLRAMAVASGMTDSDVAAATYIIRLLPPAFTPAPGVYDAPLNVTMSNPNSGANVHYTTNGATPTVASPIYSAPIALTQPATVRAIAAASGAANSDVAAATYTLRAAAPVFNPPAGHYLLPQSVTITSATPGAAIYYTTDGSAPTEGSTRYTGPILVLLATTIRAIAVAPGWAPSRETTAAYTILIH